VDSGSPEKKLVRVTIFQHPYTLRSSGEPGETEELARAVDDLMTQIAARGAGSDPMRVAVLSSLHLADRVRYLERQLSAILERAGRIEARAAELTGDSDPPDAGNQD
jgi:cell division protein ZapA (FtsZ GTPase activity inhibitor)